MQSLPTDESRPRKRDALELVNEKLEKAIAQLRLTNQALQAAHHGLKSLTDQVEIMRQDAEMLSQEVVLLKEDYTHTLDHVPYPVLLADKVGKVEIWNSAAQRMFDFAPRATVDIELSEIPVQPSLRQIISRTHRAVLERGSTLMLRNQLVQVKPALYRMDVHFASLSGKVLVVFRDGMAGVKEQDKMKPVGSFAS